jgi:hypothetical protein
MEPSSPRADGIAPQLTRYCDLARSNVRPSRKGPSSNRGCCVTPAASSHRGLLLRRAYALFFGRPGLRFARLWGSNSSSPCFTRRTLARSTIADSVKFCLPRSVRFTKSTPTPQRSASAAWVHPFVRRISATRRPKSSMARATSGRTRMQPRTSGRFQKKVPPRHTLIVLSSRQNASRVCGVARLLSGAKRAREALDLAEPKVFSSIEHKDGFFVARVYIREGGAVLLVASGTWREGYGPEFLSALLPADGLANPSF